MNAQLDAIRWRAVDAIASALLLLVVDRSEVERPQESDRLADSRLLGLRSDDESVVVLSYTLGQRFEASREKSVIVGNQNFHRETRLRSEIVNELSTYFAYQSLLEQGVASEVAMLALELSSFCLWFKIPIVAVGGGLYRFFRDFIRAYRRRLCLGFKGSVIGTGSSSLRTHCSNKTP